MLSKNAIMKFNIAAQEALLTLAREHGIPVEVTPNSDWTRVTCTVSKTEDDAKTEFELYAAKFGYPTDWFNKVFMQSGHRYQIVGCKPTAEKNCLRIKRLKDGKEFVCGVYFVDPLVHFKAA